MAAREPRTWTVRSAPPAGHSTTTDWSTNRAMRQRCLLQLQSAIEAEQEDLREELIAEVGCPAATTQRRAAGLAAGRGAALPGTPDRRVRLGTCASTVAGCSATATSARWSRKRSVSSRRSARRIIPIEVILNKLGPALAAGNTVVLKPDPNTPWNATRLGRLIAEHTDIPAGVVNVVPTPSNEVAGLLAHRSAGGHGLVHRVDRGGQAADASRCGHHEAHLPRTRRQVGTDRARRCRSGAGSSTVHWLPACTRVRPVPRQPGYWSTASLFDDAVAGVTAGFEMCRSATRPMPATFVGPVISAAQK